MDYVYDIVLNFLDQYYDFYEWNLNDKIINIKKLPIYRVSTKDYVNIKFHVTVIDKNCLVKNSKIFLITNGIEVMGIMINENGKVVKKSSLMFDESDEILEDKEQIKRIDLKYTIIKKNKLNYESRALKEKKLFLKNYFKNIDKTNDEYLLKYIYYDIFHVEEENVDKIYDELILLIKSDIDKIYDIIKQLNIEIKRSH